MSSLSRFKTIFSANIHALLDKAEDPVKMRAALLREMADAMDHAKKAESELRAEGKRLDRESAQLKERIDSLTDRAEQSMQAGNEDAARKLLDEKIKADNALQRTQQSQQALHDDLSRLDSDVARLKERMAQAQQLFQKDNVKQAKAAPSAADRTLSRVHDRFETLERRMDQMEAQIEAYETRPHLTIEQHAAVDQELDALRKRVAVKSTTQE